MNAGLRSFDCTRLLHWAPLSVQWHPFSWRRRWLWNAANQMKIVSLDWRAG